MSADETSTTLDILLLQARTPDDPILEHEYECFLERAGRPPEAFWAVNMATDPFGPELLADVDVVTVGGAGDYSLVEDDADWFEALFATMRSVVDRGVPMFASCFGLQAMVRALGGALARDSASSEVGTFEMRLTARGCRDPFFGNLPESFDAQLGHKDSVVELPDGCVRLAESERCPVQAVRIEGEPVYATQFHPELTARDNIERYARYIESYKGIDESYEEAMERAEALHRESPEAASLIERFLDATERRHAAA
jgi:GMP synthase (glutamine-hydrolysing)